LNVRACYTGGAVPPGRRLAAPVLALALLGLAPGPARPAAPRASVLARSGGVYVREPERSDPPAILVRLRAGIAPLDGALAFGAGSRRVAAAGKFALGPGVANSALAQAAAQAGVGAVEAPFADLATLAGAPDDGGPAARLARTYRFVLAPGADVAAAARMLQAQPDVESAQPEGRFHALWVETRGAPAAAPGTQAVGFDPNDPLYQDGTQWGLRNTGAGIFGGVAGVDIDAPGVGG